MSPVLVVVRVWSMQSCGLLDHGAKGVGGWPMGGGSGGGGGHPLSCGDHFTCIVVSGVDREGSAACVDSGQ